ncbi:MAG TPA: hypothetical protein VNJ09_09020 [Chthonomonadales bacterium]|nr:hypothetical protein [Chthonomonadales bacterium]
MSTTLEELRRLTLEQQRAEKAPAEPHLIEGGSATLTPVPSPCQEEGSFTEGEAPAEPHSPAHRSPKGIPMVRPPEEAHPPEDAHLRISADAQVSKQASKHLRKQASKQANETTSFLSRVREGIARKAVHPGGIKASVDLSPELSLRVKRYCLDHGNVPVRLVFIELLTAFLEEEGY